MNFCFASALPVGAHVEEAHKEVIGECVGLLGEDAHFLVADVGAEDSQAGDGCDVGHFLCGVGASECEWNVHFLSGFFRCGFDSAEDDEVGDGDFFPASLRAVEVLLDVL